MADDIFAIPTEIVARLRFESARCKAWNARWGEILTDFYAEAADEIERLRADRDHFESMTTFMAQFMSRDRGIFHWADEKTIREYFEKRMSHD